MSLDAIKEAFIAGELEEDFPILEAIQCGADDPLTFRGGGHLKQRKDGTFDLTCFSDAPVDRTRLLTRMLHPADKFLVEKDRYYEATGREFGLTEWKFERSTVGWSDGFGAEKMIVKLRPQRARLSATEAFTSNELRLIFCGHETRQWDALGAEVRGLEMPAASFVFDLSISRPSSGRVEVRASSKTRHPQDFRLRLTEALNFVTGLNLNPAVVDEHSKGMRTLELCPTGMRPTNESVYAPLGAHHIERELDNKALMQSYLSFTERTGRASLTHQCSIYLDHIRQTQGASLDVQAFGISVAAEGLANLLPDPDRPGAKHADFEKCLNAVLSFLAKSDHPEDARRRLEGGISSMRQVRPQDRLWAAEAKGLVDKADIKAWSSLRNSVVHPKGAAPIERSGPDIEKLLAQIHATLRLCYTTIFALIGYSGDFTDHAMPGFPVRAYPFQLPSTTTATM